MYTFIGRDKELCTLQTAYESDRSELVVVLSLIHISEPTRHGA